MIKTAKKKNYSEKCLSLFIQYLEENDYYVSQETMNFYFRINKKNQNSEVEVNHQAISNLLNSNIDKIRNEQDFLDFFTFCYLKKEPDIVLEQAIIKTPNKSDFLFFSHIEKIILSIKKNQQILFKYLNRVSFLNVSWSFIDLFLNHLKSKEDQLKLIKTLTKTTPFRIPNNQKEIYNSISEYIENPEELMPYFNHLIKIKDNESIINSIEYPHTISINFSAQKLLNANLKNDLSSHFLVSCLNEIFQKIVKSNLDLKIKNYILKYNTDTKEHSLYIFSDLENSYLHSFIFSEIINDVPRLNSSQEIKDFIQDLEFYIKKYKISFLNKKLNNELKNNLINKNQTKI